MHDSEVRVDTCCTAAGTEFLQGTKGQDAMSQTVQSHGVGPDEDVRVSGRDTLAGAFKVCVAYQWAMGTAYQSQVGTATRLLD